MAEQETSSTYTVQINDADNNRGTIFCGDMQYMVYKKPKLHSSMLQSDFTKAV